MVKVVGCGISKSKLGGDCLRKIIRFINVLLPLTITKTIKTSLFSLTVVKTLSMISKVFHLKSALFEQNLNDFWSIAGLKILTFGSKIHGFWP